VPQIQITTNVHTLQIYFSIITNEHFATHTIKGTANISLQNWTANMQMMTLKEFSCLTLMSIQLGGSQLVPGQLGPMQIPSQG